MLSRPFCRIITSLRPSARYFTGIALTCGLDPAGCAVHREEDTSQEHHGHGYYVGDGAGGLYAFREGRDEKPYEHKGQRAY